MTVKSDIKGTKAMSTILDADEYRPVGVNPASWGNIILSTSLERLFDSSDTEYCKPNDTSALNVGSSDFLPS